MRLLLLFFFCFSSFSRADVQQTDHLPRPWNDKQSLFDKLDPKLIALGEKLFFDPGLSRNRKVSCATCHQPAFSYSNGEERARGWRGENTDYNVPVLFNRIESTLQFWDGRAATLHEQIFQPILNIKEMGMDEKTLLERLNVDQSYHALVSQKFTRELIETALETFVKSLVSGDSRYDRYVAGNATALSAEEVEGKNLFFEKYKCSRCHSGANFTNDALSVRCGSTSNRYSVKYKVPTLRNLSSSKPYFHNGRLEKLEDVLQFYDQPNNEHGFLVSLADQEKLILFLSTLNAPVLSYRKSGKK